SRKAWLPVPARGSRTWLPVPAPGFRTRLPVPRPAGARIVPAAPCGCAEASMRWAMSLALTEEHLALAGSVRGWAGHPAPATPIRSVVDAVDRGAAVYRDTLRPGLAAQGLLGLHLPEALGGQGYGLPELAVATEELGRAMVPGGFLPTALAGAILT